MDGQRDGREGRQEGGRVGQEFLDGRMMAFASTFEWEGAVRPGMARAGSMGTMHLLDRPTPESGPTRRMSTHPCAPRRPRLLSSFDVRSYVVNSWECDRGKASCLRQNIQAVGTEAAQLKSTTNYIHTAPPSVLSEFRRAGAFRYILLGSAIA